jgi:predicted metal-dependent phosphoesterase TrpH
MIVRLLHHVHTRASADSAMTPREILAFCARRRIQLLAVTDHDSSASLAELEREGPRFGVTVIPGVEHSTTAGDLIALFAAGPAPSHDPRAIAAAVHAAGGLIVLPHPHHGHRLEEIPRDEIDIVESFNARQSEAANAASRALARAWGKPTLAGADAHLSCELGLALNFLVVDALDPASVRAALLGGRRRAHGVRTPQLAIEASQILAEVKRRRVTRLPRRLAKLGLVAGRTALGALRPGRGR